ncbi:hypothetical protein BPOR_0074g00050 [Botrytis porri]|uniref:Uncharacterized protein n=1 Tax=Botrytis porri TaxID=87229 RepID=A0A4Z1L093_9HELO|nr:hypothetical protein BPOR_0074g00050 [Botrytis porri]
MNPYLNTIQGASLVFILILFTILIHRANIPPQIKLLAFLLLPNFRDDLWIIACRVETSLNRIMSAIRGLFLRAGGDRNGDENRERVVPADGNTIRMMDLESGGRGIAGGDALVEERVPSFDGEESI